MAKRRNGPTIVAIIVVFGVAFTAWLLVTMRSVGFGADDFDPPDVAMPAKK